MNSELKKHASQIVKLLRRAYPDATCALHYRSPVELLVATILSAQCTDQRVNLVTRQLFRKYKSAQDFAQVPQATLEQEIRSTGFFRNKARNIRECCRALAADFGGKVPTDLDELTKLPGIGRKTANVVLGTAFGLPTGIVVDTHVARVSRRLGLTKKKNAHQIESDLLSLLPKNEWIAFSHRMIHHGRRVCQARKPRCDECRLGAICPRIDVPQLRQS
jgi:endonuclease-3